MAKTNQQIIVTEGDFGVEILTQFIDTNKKPVPIEGCSCKVKFAYDGNVITEKTGVVTDEPKGIVSVILDKEETQYSGLWTSYWICYDQFNNVTTTENIYYYVQPSIGSVNNPAFTELLNYYNRDEVNDMFKNILEQLNNYTLSKEDVEEYIKTYIQDKVDDDFVRQCILDAIGNGSDYAKKEEVSSLLDTKANKSDIETIKAQLDNVINSTRKFLPKLDRSFIFGHVNGDNGEYTSKSDIEIKNELSKIKNLNFDGIHLILHIGINKSNGKIFIAGSSNYQNTINYIYETCCEYGLELRSLKLHCEQPGTQLKLETILSTCGLDSFKQQYLDLLRDITYNNKNIVKNIIVLNELTYFYTSDDYFEFCNDCINIVKNNGYDVSISCISPNDLLSMNDKLKSSVSFFSINHYPTLSHNGLKLNISKAILSYCFESNLFQCIEYLKKMYNKPIHITETGGMDIEEALSRPWDWAFNNNKLCDGEVQKVFLDIIFNNLNFEYIKSVCYWWDINSNLGNFIKYKKGGD